MFKRFLVLDLFHGKEVPECKEWVDASQRTPEVETGIFMVKLSDGNQVQAYFCRDKIVNLCILIGEEPSYWWCKINRKPLHNVTHWGLKRIE